MTHALLRLLNELDALLAELAGPPAASGRPGISLHQNVQTWRAAALAAAEQAGRLEGQQADELCSALIAAAARVTASEAFTGARQGGLPLWLSVAVKLLHGCAALASGCLDASQSAEAVAALWRSASLVLQHSAIALQVATSRLTESGFSNGVLATINSHSKPIVALLQCPSSNQPSGSQPGDSQPGGSQPNSSQHSQPDLTPVPLQSLILWLLAAGQALRTLRPTHGLTDEYAVCLGRVLELLLLLDSLPRSQLAPQMQRQQHVALCAAALDIVLPQLTAAAVGLSLPVERRRAWCTWPHAAQCAAAAMCRFVQPAVAELLQAASRDRGGPAAAKLARLLQAAATLVQHMPATTVGQQAGGATCQCQLLALLVAALQDHVSLTRRSGIVAAQLQQARHLLPLLPRLASMTAPEGRSAAPLPQVVSTASQLLYYLSDLATTSCTGAHSLVQSLADVPDWCAAAATALRMLPAAAEAAQQADEGTAAASAAQHAEDWTAAATDDQAVPRQPSPASLALTANVLAQAIGQQCCTAAGQAAATAALDDPATRAAITSLLQLHSTACRAAAWAAASGARQWLPSLNTGAHFGAMVAAPAAAICWLLCGSPGRCQLGALSQPACRQADSLAVAHIAALSSLADSSNPAGTAWLLPASASSVIDGLVSLLQCGPASLAAHPDVQPLFLSSLSALPQEGDSRWEFLQLSVLKASVARTPLLGALLLGTRAWEALGGEKLEHATGRQLMTPLVHALLVLLQRLHDAAAQALPEAASSGSSHPAAPQLLSAVTCWNRAVGPTSSGANGQGSLEVYVDHLRTQLQPASTAAKDLSAALLDWWRRPEAQQAATLELAQAASHRSCAYLRCANLGGEGGPAAGEGVSSMRCSACRAVWYCGTACSHADWRAGHRRVCKALGTARAAEKERRRQQEAEASAGVVGEEESG